MRSALVLFLWWWSVQPLIADAAAITIGAHTAVMSGPLTLNHDGSTKIAQVTMYYKALPHTCTRRPPDAPIPPPNTTHEFRAVMFFTDPAEQQHGILVIEDMRIMHDNLLPPDWQQHLTPPTLRLQPLKYHNRAYHPNISIAHAFPHNPSELTTLINATTQRYAYQNGILTAHAPLHYRSAIDGGVLQSHYGGEWALCVADWWQCARVPMGMLLGKAQGDCTVGTERYWLVIKPLFAGALLYDNGGYEAALRAHPLLTAFLDKGQLRIVQWGAAQGGSVVPATNSQLDEWPEWGIYDQVQVYTHASMAAWGTNSYLLFSDVDEFLVLPKGDLQSSACIRYPWSYLQLDRANYMCSGNPPPVPPSSFNDTSAIKRRVLTTYLRCNRAPEPMWMDWPKVLAHADALASMVVHDGLVWPEWAHTAQSPVDQACAKMVHLNNLVHDRHTEPGGVKYVEESRWLQPLFDALRALD